MSDTSNSALARANARQKLFIIITVMCVAILEVLDSTIVNVALPHMMPALGANQEEVTWVLTSYVVASAIMLPLTGYLSKRLGEKTLLLINTAGFMLASFFCGLATSLSIMVLCRCLQGAFGAALIPLSQSFLKQSFPPEEQGKAMGIWAMGVLVGPVLGPTLGGLIIEHASWRWIFYINLPMCAAALWLANAFIPATQGKKTATDWINIAWMILGVGALQLFLDQGNSNDWFESNKIMLLFVLSFIGMIGFITRSLTAPQPAIQLKIFANRDFSLSTLCLAIFCATQFSILTLEPILLQTAFGYTALLSGITLMPMGLFSGLAVSISSRLINRFSVRYILTTGIFFSILGSHYLAGLSLAATQHHFMLANGLMGFGMGFFMVPLSVYSLASLPKEHVTEGAGLYSYGRMLGTSIGISLMSTLVSRLSQVNWNTFGAHLTPYSANTQQWLQAHHLQANDPAGLAQLQLSLHQQASFTAFIDAFHLASYCFASMILLVWFMRPINFTSTTTPQH